MVVQKIYEIQDVDLELEDVKEKVNELVRAVNGLKCVDEEEPIYETLSPNEVLINSKNEEGLLVASNNGLGTVRLKRVKYPREEEQKNERR